MNHESPFIANHFTDANGNPSGGITTGRGFTVGWQNGPLGRHSDNCVPGHCAEDCTRKPPNGAFVEDLIAAAIDRLQFYQNSRFACAANELAIEHLRAANLVLHQRTADRENRKVEGLNKA